MHEQRQDDQSREFEAALAEADNRVGVTLPATDEVDNTSNALVVTETFGSLESPREVALAAEVFQSFVEFVELEPSRALVVASRNAVVYFPEHTISSVQGFKELAQSGELAPGEEPSPEVVDVVGHYIEEASKFGLSTMDPLDIARELGLDDTLRGLDLISTLCNLFEESAGNAFTPEILWRLGAIDGEQYERIKSDQEEEAVFEIEVEEQLAQEAADDAKVRVAGNEILRRLVEGGESHATDEPETNPTIEEVEII